VRSLFRVVLFVVVGVVILHLPFVLALAGAPVYRASWAGLTGFTGSILILLVLGGLVALAIRLARSEPSSRPTPAGEDESRMIQEIHQNLSRMEERIEALETLLLERPTRISSRSKLS